MESPQLDDFLERKIPSPFLRVVVRQAIDAAADSVLSNVRARQETCDHPRRLHFAQPLLNAHLRICTSCAHIIFEEHGKR